MTGHYMNPRLSLNWGCGLGRMEADGSLAAASLHN
jgi:hypothetical protein